MKDETKDKVIPVVWIFSLCSVVLGILALITIPLYKSITADARIEYCYVDSVTHRDVTFYDLRGFRSWRGDAYIVVNLRSLDQVKEAAETYGCELK